MNIEAQQQLERILAKNPNGLGVADQKFLLARKKYIPTKLQRNYPFLNQPVVKPIVKPVEKKAVKPAGKRRLFGRK